MAGLFDGLELGKRALATHQLWMNTIGHNIANVNTPGYTRQRVNITTTIPFDDPVGPVGTGVTATDIRQVRDLFLNSQYRTENRSLGRWTASEKILTQLEALLGEPDENSLGGLLDKFWACWSDLATNPESMAARTALKEQTNLLTDAFHRLSRQMLDMQKSADNDISLATDKINTLAREIASLNMQIARAELGTANANDLRDKRDLAIDELSRYVDINVRELANGTATVYIGAMAIVEGTSSFDISTIKSRGQAIAASDVVWGGSKEPIKILDGELKGLFDIRDDVIPRYLQALDDIAEALVNNVNALHRSGYGLSGRTGVDFFDPGAVSASNITLSQDINIDAARIAASQSGEVGDNAIALAIADLKSDRLMMKGMASINEFYATKIGEIGIETDRAGTLKENYELLVAQLDNARQSVQGVSLDEEMAQMIKFQHAYDAAARVITVMDQSLETVIHGMGIVGR
jgi:flagellar hook-associated protein 1 FlgK